MIIELIEERYSEDVAQAIENGNHCFLTEDEEFTDDPDEAAYVISLIDYYPYVRVSPVLEPTAEEKPDIWVNKEMLAKV